MRAQSPLARGEDKQMKSMSKPAVAGSETIVCVWEGGLSSLGDNSKEAD